MKRANFLNLLLAGLVVAVVATGCKKRSPHITHIPGAPTTLVPDPGGLPPVDSQRPGPGAGEGGPIAEGGQPTTETIPGGGAPLAGLETIEGMIADRERFKANTVYFDFDRAAVKASERAKVEDVANYLKSSPQNKLQVEGHCDERGTEEYNRALGERRALAVREYLITLGIASERVFTISYGEDRPALEGEGEPVWSKNRRGEFILLLPKPQQ